MDQQQMFMMLPGMQPEELMLIQTLTKDMNEKQKQQFLMFYQGKRKDPQTLLILTLIGFFGFAGIHRFVIGEVAMGIIYFLTLGFCGIGTILDAINNKKIAADFNQKQAIEAAGMVMMMEEKFK